MSMAYRTNLLKTILFSSVVLYILKVYNPRAGEVTQGLSALAVLPWYPHGSSEPSVTPVPGNPSPSSRPPQASGPHVVLGLTYR